jgi:acetyltransferase-like isoleucine patch superfamily enzyme
MIKKFLKSLYLNYKFSDNLIIGDNSIVNIKNIILNKNSFGKIIIGNNVICSAQLYSFLNLGKIKIGNFCYIGENTRIWSLESIEIGDRVLISHNVFIVDNLTHSIDPQLRHLQFKSKFGSPLPNNLNLDPSPIIIENDVWIGANAIILKGIKIGCGAIIGAGAVVTNDVPGGYLAIGNPCILIKK